MPATPVSRAILLAAGRGTRLGSLTQTLPKPLLPVAGRPLLCHIVEGLRDAGIREFLMVVGYRAEAVREAFGDGSAQGTHIRYIDQGERHGTAAALARGRTFAGDEPILMSYGDILVDPANYARLLGAWSAGLAALIGLNHVADPSAGAAVYRRGDSIVRLVEKPAPGTSQTSWNVAGVSVFGPPIWQALDAIALSPRGELELTDAISALIASGHAVHGFELDGLWVDVGTPEALALADTQWGRQ